MVQGPAPEAHSEAMWGEFDPPGNTLITGMAMNEQRNW